MSRRNLCPNPAAKNNATGYSGTGTPVRATDFPTPACPRSTGVRASTAGFLQMATAACSPGDVFTLSFYGHNGSVSDFDFGHTVYIAYTRSSGGDVFPETHGFTTGAVGTTARFSFTAAAAPALATGIYLLWDSLQPGYGATGVLLEKVGALDSYADGDTASWVWDGTNGNSTSSEVTTTPVGIQLDLRWSIAQVASKQVDLRWSIAEIVGKQIDLRWSVAQIVGKQVELDWSIAQIVNSQLDLRWSVAQQVAAQLDLRWSVAAIVGTQIDLRWAIDGRVKKQLDLRWSIAGNSPTPTGKFIIINRRVEAFIANRKTDVFIVDRG